MAEGDNVFASSIPEIYDTCLVPLLFETYATDLVERTSALAPVTVLETEAGSGVVTRALASRLASDSRYTVTDLVQPMLDRAATRQGPDDRITWRQADALKLPFDDASFDAVVCQFGVMFFPDKIAGYAETRRVLKPGGSFLFNVGDRLETNEICHEVNEEMKIIFSDDPPGFIAGAPFGYYDVDIIRDELVRGGFSQFSIATLEETSSAPTPRHAAVTLCQGAPLRTEIDSRDAGRLDHVTDRVTEAIAVRFGGGPVSGEMRAHIVVAA